MYHIKPSILFSTKYLYLNIIEYTNVKSAPGYSIVCWE